MLCDVLPDGYDFDPELDRVSALRCLEIAALEVRRTLEPLSWCSILQGWGLRPTQSSREDEKARLVCKLRHARERVRQEKGKCEGRKPHGELRPEAVALAKRLHRASPKTGKRMSLRKIAAALAEAGHLNERGQPWWRI